MSRIKSYKIGRSSECEIQLSDDSISRVHAELTKATSGRLHLADAGSTHGTHVVRGGKWVAIKQEIVSSDEPILLGRYQTTASALAEYANKSAGRAVDHAQGDGGKAREMLPPGRKLRNPETGEVIVAGRNKDG